MRRAYLAHLLGDVEVDGVGLVSALDALLAGAQRTRACSRTRLARVTDCRNPRTATRRTCLNGSDRTLGWCRSHLSEQGNVIVPEARTSAPRDAWLHRHLGPASPHQLSAFSPARRVQWMRDCWPAPRPTTCRQRGRSPDHTGRQTSAGERVQGRHPASEPGRSWRSRPSWTGCT